MYGHLNTDRMMKLIGLGTVVNTAAIIAGGVAGSFIRNGLKQRFKDIIMQGIGLAVLVLGISGALQGIFNILGDGRIERQYIMTMILSLVIGGIAGELLNIEERLDKLGMWLQNRFAKNGGTFAEGFVTSSLVYCVGAMAIVGSLEDGLTGNSSTLLAKSILDGVSAVVFASTLGIGVSFSSISVLLYQGSITLLAGSVKPWLTGPIITQMSLIGSILIAAIGINLLEIKRIKVGNLVPAMFIPLIYSLVEMLIKSIF